MVEEYEAVGGEVVVECLAVWVADGGVGGVGESSGDEQTGVGVGGVGGDYGDGGLGEGIVEEEVELFV